MQDGRRSSRVELRRHKLAHYSLAVKHHYVSIQIIGNVRDSASHSDRSTTDLTPRRQLRPATFTGLTKTGASQSVANPQEAWGGLSAPCSFFVGILSPASPPSPSHNSFGPYKFQHFPLRLSRIGITYVGAAKGTQIQRSSVKEQVAARRRAHN